MSLSKDMLSTQASIWNKNSQASSNASTYWSQKAGLSIKHVKIVPRCNSFKVHLFLRKFFLLIKFSSKIKTLSEYPAERQYNFIGNLGESKNFLISIFLADMCSCNLKKIKNKKHITAKLFGKSAI